MTPYMGTVTHSTLGQRDRLKGVSISLPSYDFDKIERSDLQLCHFAKMAATWRLPRRHMLDLLSERTYPTPSNPYPTIAPLTPTKTLGAKLPAKGTKSGAALSNRSLVFEIFPEGEKLTIPEALLRVNELTKAREELPLSERTVRRSIDALVDGGFLKVYGKQNNAILYGRLSASYSDAKDKLISFGGELMSVKDFLHTIVDPHEKPLQKSAKLAIVSSEIEHQIRRRLAFVIWSAGNPGHNAQLQTVMKELHAVLNEVNYLSNLLQSFLDSAVWYEHYRDRIGLALRKVQETDADLFQLTDEYVKGG